MLLKATLLLCTTLVVQPFPQGIDSSVPPSVVVPINDTDSPSVGTFETTTESVASPEYPHNTNTQGYDTTVASTKRSDILEKIEKIKAFIEKKKQKEESETSADTERIEGLAKILETLEEYEEIQEEISRASASTKPSAEKESKASAKCRNYAKLVQHTEEDSWKRFLRQIREQIIREQLIDLFTKQFPDLRLISKKKRIFEGTPAKSGEFPHMATIIGRMEHSTSICSGTLISERFVLTAAHCDPDLYGRNSTKMNMTVLLGKLYFNSSKTYSTEYVVKRKIVHPEFKNSTYHDIMLLELSESVEFNKYVRPICLCELDRIDETEGIITGYGASSWKNLYHSSTGSHYERLRKAKVPLLSYSTCSKLINEKMNKIALNSTIQVCAGDDGNGATCRGDSGGPLQILKNGFYIQVGILSIGSVLCDQLGVPSVFTRVSAYISWIEEHVWS